jgi:2-polyprenyl-3-methyl-5-hydroxy-6-metoxy-1,4-benzoquinol methylase
VEKSVASLLSRKIFAMNDSERSALKEALEAAIRATSHMQETYNNYLRKIDELHAIPPMEDSSPIVRQLQKSLNELYDISAALPRQELKQQKEWNAVTVHLLNELIDYVAKSSYQTRLLLEQQVLFFQQITPWMDAKLQQQRKEEKAEVAESISQVGELLKGSAPENILAQFYSLQSQLYEKSLANERRLQELWERLIGSPNIPEMQEITRIKTELQELRDKFVTPASGGPSSSSEPRGDAGATNFPLTRDFRYFAFEEIFRGSSEWLSERLKAYVPYFVTAPEPVLDIGCGRGEFLEIMRQIGKQSYGIEMNQYEVDTLTKKGLQVIAEEILPHLQKLQNESVGSVFCAQVVEHLSPNDVYQMLARLMIVMKHGSCVVIETINPLSVFAFHHLYFKDPSHIFPVHPQTLAFLLRYAGFQNVEIHPITPVPESEKLPKPSSLPNPETEGYLNYIVEKLNDLLYSNLEYYVVGHKL